jgi:hypothetical protein
MLLGEGAGEPHNMLLEEWRGSTCYGATCAEPWRQLEVGGQCKAPATLLWGRNPVPIDTEALHLLLLGN